MNLFLLKSFGFILIINAALLDLVGGFCFNSWCNGHCYFKNGGFNYGRCENSKCQCKLTTIYVIDENSNLSDKYIENASSYNVITQTEVLKIKNGQQDNTKLLGTKESVPIKRDLKDLNDSSNQLDLKRTSKDIQTQANSKVKLPTTYSPVNFNRASPINAATKSINTDGANTNSILENNKKLKENNGKTEKEAKDTKFKTKQTIVENQEEIEKIVYETIEEYTVEEMD